MATPIRQVLVELVSDDWGQSLAGRLPVEIAHQDEWERHLLPGPRQNKAAPNFSKLVHHGNPPSLNGNFQFPSFRRNEETSLSSSSSVASFLSVLARQEITHTLPGI